MCVCVFVVVVVLVLVLVLVLVEIDTSVLRPLSWQGQTVCVHLRSNHGVDRMF